MPVLPIEDAEHLKLSSANSATSGLTLPGHQHPPVKDVKRDRVTKTRHVFRLGEPSDLGESEAWPGNQDTDTPGIQLGSAEAVVSG